VAGGGLVTPDPDRAVDIVIHSPHWIEPGVLVGIIQRVLPGARLAVEGEEWEGPAPEVYAGAVILGETSSDPLAPADLAALHSNADQNDLARLAAQDVLDGYAVVADIGPFGEDGAVEVLAHAGDAGDPAVADQDWAAEPFVTYEIRWSCPEPEERERRLPSPTYLASRGRVQPLVVAVARAVVEAAAGVVTDEDGFWIDRYTL
jgi:hypothetical protein